MTYSEQTKMIGMNNNFNKSKKDKITRNNFEFDDLPKLGWNKLKSLVSWKDTSMNQLIRIQNDASQQKNQTYQLKMNEKKS